MVKILYFVNIPLILLMVNMLFTMNGQETEHSERKFCQTDGEFSTRKTFRGIFSFPTEPIPDHNCSSDEAFQLITQSKPVILKGCTFAESALQWDINYLSENLMDDTHPIYVSKSRNFHYYDISKVTGVFTNWTAPHETRQTSFQDFMEIVQDIVKGNNASRAYFQSLLFPSDMSPQMTEDSQLFNHSWLLELVSGAGWHHELINVLFVGMRDVVTPAHYDTFENLYLQISGMKRCILFNPEHFTGLYPYPLGHPHDRQTQVNFDLPDFNKFPRFADVKGLEYALEPGDVLYIPKYWWHYFESEMNNMTVSINFWFNPKEIDESQIEENQIEKKPEMQGPGDYLALRRLVEETVYNGTGKNPQHVKRFFQELLEGRFEYT